MTDTPIWCPICEMWVPREREPHRNYLAGVPGAYHHAADYPGAATADDLGRAPRTLTADGPADPREADRPKPPA